MRNRGPRPVDDEHRARTVSENPFRLSRLCLRFRAGPVDYTLAWVLLTFLGLLGIHRLYMGKWLTGIVYLLTGGIFGVGYLYDFWTLNDQITLINGS